MRQSGEGAAKPLPVSLNAHTDERTHPAMADMTLREKQRAEKLVNDWLKRKTTPPAEDDTNHQYAYVPAPKAVLAKVEKIRKLADEVNEAGYEIPNIAIAIGTMFCSDQTTRLQRTRAKWEAEQATKRDDSEVHVRRAQEVIRRIWADELTFADLADFTKE